MVSLGLSKKTEVFVSGPKSMIRKNNNTNSPALLAISLGIHIFILFSGSLLIQARNYEKSSFIVYEVSFLPLIVDSHAQDQGARLSPNWTQKGSLPQEEGYPEESAKERSFLKEPHPTEKERIPTISPIEGYGGLEDVLNVAKSTLPLKLEVSDKKETPRKEPASDDRKESPVHETPHAEWSSFREKRPDLLPEHKLTVEKDDLRRDTVPPAGSTGIMGDSRKTGVSPIARFPETGFQMAPETKEKPVVETLSYPVERDGSTIRNVSSIDPKMQRGSEGAGSSPPKSRPSGISSQAPQHRITDRNAEETSSARIPAQSSAPLGYPAGKSDTGSISGSEKIIFPRLRHEENHKPQYPREARRKGLEGEVIVRAEILPDGNVGRVEIKKSSGHDILDRSALEAVKDWKFEPAMKGNNPISYWVNIPIRFQLR